MSEEMVIRCCAPSPLFEAGVNYTVTVAAFGYTELTFSCSKTGETAETGI